MVNKTAIDAFLKERFEQLFPVLVDKVIAAMDYTGDDFKKFMKTQKELADIFRITQTTVRSKLNEMGILEQPDIDMGAKNKYWDLRRFIVFYQGNVKRQQLFDKAFEACNFN